MSCAETNNESSLGKLFHKVIASNKTTYLIWSYMQVRFARAIDATNCVKVKNSEPLEYK